MHCNQARELLSDYIDGLLAESQHASVAMHLTTCSACRSELNSLAATVKLLNGMEITQPPPRLAQRITEGLHRQGLYPPRRWNMRRVVNGVAAAAAVFILVSIVALQGSMLNGDQSQASFSRRPRSFSQGYSSDYLDPSYRVEIEAPSAPSTPSQMIFPMQFTQ